MKILILLSIVLMLNTVFYMAQATINYISGEIYSDGTINNYFTGTGNIIGEFNNSDGNLKNDGRDRLPREAGGIDATDSTLWSKILDWGKSFLTSFGEATGLKYVYDYVNAVPHFLNIMGMPYPFVFALGFFWQALGVFLIASVIRGFY